MNKEFAPQACHYNLMRSMNQPLSYQNALSERTKPELWKKACYEKLDELLGDYPEKTDPDFEIEFTVEREEYTEIRFTFQSEECSAVPCHLLIPKGSLAPLPVVICLQGHTTGMHISMGRQKYPGDSEYMARDADFAIQAVREGYAALAIEQRCFGERNDSRPQFDRRSTINGCAHASMSALLLGRTMLRERIWDVSRAIDVLDNFPQIDLQRIGCMGNSGGGVVSYFAGCMEPRIKVSMPSCAVCNFEDSFLKIDHCVDNYIPAAFKHFEMGDLACLIAPRYLVVVAAALDIEFPIEGSVRAFKTIEKVYDLFGCRENCSLILGEEGHRFYPQYAWKAFARYI